MKYDIFHVFTTKLQQNSIFIFIPIYHKHVPDNVSMMTSSNGNIFRVTCHLCEEFTGPRWIPHTKASDAELWCLLWSEPE